MDVCLTRRSYATSFQSYSLLLASLIGHTSSTGNHLYVSCIQVQQEGAYLSNQ